MQVDQIIQLMNINKLNGLQDTSQSSSNSGLYDSSSMFQSLLQTQINNMLTQSVDNGSTVTAASAQSSTGGLSLQPEKINQMIQIMLMQSMLSGSSIGSSDENSAIGGNSGNNGMSQILQLMLMNMISQQTQSSSGTQTSSGSGNESSGTNSSIQETKSVDTPKNLGMIASQDIEKAIDAASEKYGVDKDFIKAVIKQESGFHQNAVSSAGAVGLMQLMPSTAKSLGVNPYNPIDNIDGGTKYLRNLLNAFNGNKKLALAAYNGGISRMNRLGVDTTEEISKMPKETRNYVANVIKIYETNKSV